MQRVILVFACGALLAPAQDRRTVQLLVGGDVNWSLDMAVPSIYHDKGAPPAEGWRPSPYRATPQSRVLLEKELGKPLETPRSHHRSAIQYGLKFSSKLEEVRHPFLKIRPFLQEHDVVFVNLENPLSDTGRRVGAFRAPALLADALRWAGITVVSIANNHMLDAEGQGLVDTISNLSRAGVGHAGAGRNLEDARRPWLVEKHGVRIAFLSYTQHANMGDSSYAQPDHSGVMPMDPFLMEEDIRRVRDRADYVAVSIHWGTENRLVHPANRKFAHKLVDFGADLVLGDHSPMAKGVEVYKGRLIVYSQGHLIFGHNHEEWGSGYLIRATLAPRKIEGVEILPISGKGHDMGQPYLLKGAEAREVLAEVQTRSAALDTPVRIDGDRGIVAAGFERR